MNILPQVENALSAVRASFLHDPSGLTASIHLVDELLATLEQTSDGCHAMVVTRDRLIPVPLPDLDHKKLYENISMLTATQLTGVGAFDMRKALMQLLPAVLSDLRHTILTPLVPALEDAGLTAGNRLVFAPDGVMNFLPLHALEVADGVRLGDRANESSGGPTVERARDELMSAVSDLFAASKRVF